MNLNKYSLFVWDCEVFPNYLLFCFIDVKTQERIEFSYLTTPTLGDLGKFEQFILDPNKAFIGYNSSFDENIAAATLYLYSVLRSPDRKYNMNAFIPVIKAVANCMISSDDYIDAAVDSLFMTDTFPSNKGIAYETRVALSEYKKQNSFHRPKILKHLSIDLMRLHDLQTSLKLLEAKSGCRILESAINFDIQIKEDSINQIREYCYNDCEILITLFHRAETINGLSLRSALSEKFGVAETQLIPLSSPAVVSSVIPTAVKRQYNILSLKSLMQHSTNAYKDVSGADIIDQIITAQTEPFKTLLCKMRSHIYLNGSEVNSYNEKIGSYTVGIGGLHSDFPPVDITADEDTIILDLDVTSFYPTLILKYNLGPESWRNEFLTVYKQIYEDRLKAKKQGRTTEANGLKLLLNSTYGKFGVESSVFFSPLSRLGVVLNGQAWLLELLDSVTQVPGLQVLQANTDGITICFQQTELGLVQQIRGNWEQKSGFKLEEKKYVRFFAKDVNNYIAIDTLGEAKVKGCYAPNELFQSGGIVIPPVVKLAAVEYIRSGKPIEEFVANHKNAIDFMICGKRKNLRVNDTAANFTVYRAYFVKNGVTLKYEKSDGSFCTVAENVCLALENVEIDYSNLDYSRYIEMTKKLILFGAEDEESKFSELPNTIGEIYSAYIKKYGENNFSRKLGETRALLGSETWGTIRVRGSHKKISVMTKEFNLSVVIPPQLCVLDIDAPEALKKKMQGLLPATLANTKHTDDIFDIISYKKKAHLWYKLPEGFEGFISNTKKWILKDGDKTVAELCFPGAEITVPPSQSTKPGEKNYHWIEAPIVAIGSEILNVFQKSEISVIAKRKDDSEDSLAFQISQQYNSILKPKRHYYCCEHYEKNPSAYLYPDGHLFCFSCRQQFYIDDYLGRCEEHGVDPNRGGWAPVDSVEPVEEKAEITVQLLKKKAEKYIEEFKTFEELYSKIFSSPDPGAIVTAPTGAGKSTAMANWAIELMRSGEFVVIIANIKSDMAQFQEIIEKKINPDEMEKIQVISRDDDGDLKKGTRLVITHKTYFTRKGVSLLHYAIFIRALKQKPIIFIDECQAYIQAQRFTIPLGGRYFEKHFRDHGIVRKEVLSGCPVFEGRGNCSLCRYSEKVFLRANSDGVLEVRPLVEGHTGTDFQGEKIVLDGKITEKFSAKTMNLALLDSPTTSSRTYRAVVTEESIEIILEDLLRTGFEPKLFWSQPCKNTGEPVRATDLATAFEGGGGQETKKNTFFPKLPCEVKFFDTLDTSSLALIAMRAKKTILFSATLTAAEEIFISHCFQKTITKYISVNNYKPIDELLILLTPEELKFTAGKTMPLEPISNNLKSGEKCLIFEPTKKGAVSVFESLPRSIKAFMYGDSLMCYESRINEDEPPKICTTWANGPLARGVNRPNDQVCIVNCDINFPFYYYNSSKLQLEELSEAAKIDVIVQQGGRILRGSGRKIMILHHLESISPSGIQAIVTAWQGVVKAPIKVIKTEYPEYLWDCAYRFRNNEPLNSELAFMTEQMRGKSNKKLSKTQREKRKKILSQGPTKQEEKLARARELARQGVCFSQIYDTLNLGRDKSIAQQIKQMCESYKNKKIVETAQAMIAEGKSLRDISIKLNLYRNPELKQEISKLFEKK